MAPTPRQRISLREMEAKYHSGEDKSLLENLIRAFRGIQEKVPDYTQEPETDHSFFRIAGFHGEPFQGEGITDPKWWGGYCHHGDVLFPVWHRAYLFHLENALREIDGCQDVTLPFWDETWTVLNQRIDPNKEENPNKKDESIAYPIPAVLTTPTFELDNRTDNPLYSYKLQKSLADEVRGAEQRYTKPQGYETKRYPLSGLVGTREDQVETEIQNTKYSDQAQCTDILNKNVKAWLDGKVEIEEDPCTPDARNTNYGVKDRLINLAANDNYTLFSNNTSAKDKPVVALESPHDSMHLAVGGMFQYAKYNADPIRGANGDMGDNETAGFDPIFFFHHCFIDYVFWLWQQKHNKTAKGSLSIDETDPGAISGEGSFGTKPGTPLTVDYPLTPFKDPNDAESWMTLEKVTDIENQLGYTYGPGSLDPYFKPKLNLPEFDVRPIVPVAFKTTPKIDRSKYAGSFVIRTFAQTPNRKLPVEIGREAILSRWNLYGCQNCMDRLSVKASTVITADLKKALLEGEEEGAQIEYFARIQHRGVPYRGGLEGTPGEKYLDLETERIALVDVGPPSLE